MDIRSTIKHYFNTENKTNYAYAAAALIGVAALIWAFSPGSVLVETSIVERGLFEETVQEDGSTRVREKFLLLSPFNGILKRVEKHAGDRVKKGEAVAVVHWDQQTTVRSPESGVILKILREDEGPVEMGQPIMEIGNVRSIEIVIDVLSQDAVNIKSGNAIHIVRWGGDQPLEARVRRVEPQAFVKISSLGVEERRVRVVADIVSPPEVWENLGDNFRLECRVVIHAERGALKVHTGALFREGESWMVYRIIKGRATKTAVQLGRKSTLEAVVKSGLSEGDEVILYPGNAVQEGTKVKRM
jgi:HlyD family secretion protein